MLIYAFTAILVVMLPNLKLVYMPWNQYACQMMPFSEFLTLPYFDHIRAQQPGGNIRIVAFNKRDIELYFDDEYAGVDQFSGILCLPKLNSVYLRKIDIYRMPLTFLKELLLHPQFFSKKFTSMMLDSQRPCYV
jgi:hypothetical protein